MMVGFTACTLLRPDSVMVDVTGQEAAAHLARGRTFLAAGDFESARRENEAVLSLAGHGIPLDEALFRIGLIEAHPANPERDAKKALSALSRLLHDHPASPLGEEAKVLSELIREQQWQATVVSELIRRNERVAKTVSELTAQGERARGEKDRLNQSLAGLQQENEGLARTIERLNQIIVELKKVDLVVEQKKRGMGR
jgi:hypothetical protein